MLHSPNWNSLSLLLQFWFSLTLKNLSLWKSMCLGGCGAVTIFWSPGQTVLCVFFRAGSCQGEKNYGVGDWELLAVKLALGKWQLLLEGTKHLFTIWTYYKNLIYLRTAKRLNACQAGWPLFRFNFSISYHPGSRNIKPDALSCLFSANAGPRSMPEFYRPPARLLQWCGRLRTASVRRNPTPALAPPNR